MAINTEIPASGTRIRIKKSGHTFNGYTGTVKKPMHPGSTRYIEIKLDDGQDFKGGSGFTFVALKSLVKLD